MFLAKQRIRQQGKKTRRRLGRLIHAIRRAIVSKRIFHFRSGWELQGNIDDVADLFLQTENICHWWSDCFAATEVIEPGNENADGRVVRLVTRGALPYYLKFNLRISGVEYPNRFVVHSDGNFVGRGVVRLSQSADKVIVNFDWRILFDKPILKYFSRLLRPFFVANHRWIMHRGQIHAHSALTATRCRDSREASAEGSGDRLPPRKVVDTLEFLALVKQVLTARPLASAWVAGEGASSQ